MLYEPKRLENPSFGLRWGFSPKRVGQRRKLLDLERRRIEEEEEEHGNAIQFGSLRRLRRALKRNKGKVALGWGLDSVSSFSGCGNNSHEGCLWNRE